MSRKESSILRLKETSNCYKCRNRADSHNSLHKKYSKIRSNHIVSSLGIGLVNANLGKRSLLAFTVSKSRPLASKIKETSTTASCTDAQCVDQRGNKSGKCIEYRKFHFGNQNRVKQ